ncbi:hypothetical protein KY290_007952 [Solanum tuberosum]|uniref:Uncharacterized protein n=1 Tax=Solanum tuberosum TaxID=4113 RepID=A0ABQ7W705_SOLTU|nr:hypothetical protein KY290_007952 [Solanum tuberosum]
MRMTNDKIMDQTIEKEYPPSKLISCLEKKIRELEDDVSDMREWAKMLLSVNPTLETNMDRQPATSQAIFQNNPPPAYPTSNPQNQSSSIHMPPTHFPNYLYPTLQAPLYETPLYQVSWLKVAGCVTPIPAKNPYAQFKWYDPNKICEYHSGIKGHTTEECCAMRNKIHQLIEAKVIHWIDLVPKGFQP